MIALHAIAENTRKTVCVGRVMRAVCRAVARRRPTVTAVCQTGSCTPDRASRRVHLGSMP